MSNAKIRRCHITCRIESTETMAELIACDKFVSVNQREFTIYRMLAAYNCQTKDARIYAEFDRVYEKTIEEHMNHMGAGSVIIDSFPKEDWENASEIALNGVLECSSKPGFSIFGQESGMTLKNVEELKAKLIAKRQTSSSARRQNPSSAMGSGGACDSLSEEEEVFSEEDVPGTQSAGNWSGPKASHSNKRARSKSPSSTGQQGFHRESGRYVGLVETMFRDSVQQREEMMLGLKKQVISLNRELNLAKERAKGAAATTEKLQVAEREVSEQRGHVIELRAVDQAAPAALVRHQLGVHQLLEVERQRRRRHAQRGRQGPGRQPQRRGAHQGTKHPQPHGLGQCGQRGDGGFFFHLSIFMETNDGLVTSRSVLAGCGCGGGAGAGVCGVFALDAVVAPSVRFGDFFWGHGWQPAARACINASIHWRNRHD